MITRRRVLATTAMTHIAIAVALEGKSVDWMEQVSDQRYGTWLRFSQRLRYRHGPANSWTFWP